MIDQCPSTTGKKDSSKARPLHSQRAAHSAVGAGKTGRAYWRSLDDLADTAEFRDWLEREFPSGASELLTSTRRTFVKLMGASLALAGAATLPGCRRPEHKIMPYSKTVPEETVPGRAEYFATSMPLPGGGAEGLLVESHEGRPTKIEGNPLHSINAGRSSIWSQASILDTYDPDRLKDPVFTDRSDAACSWDDFKAWSKDHAAAFDAAHGAGLAFLVEKKTSPTRDTLKARLLERWPEALWIPYDPVQSDEPIRGSAVAFGRPMREIFALESADVIVSFDRDFLQLEPQSLPAARGFASRRGPMSTSDSMNRLYVVESGFSITGAKADHRLRMAPSAIPTVAVALAKEILAQIGSGGSGPLSDALGAVTIPQGAPIDPKWISAVAEDLVWSAPGERRTGRTLIMAGPTQPAPVHALVHALNDLLGNGGKTVSYLPMSEDEAASSVQGIQTLCQHIDAGRITTLVCFNVNPVYDAPAELDFQARFAKVATRITLSVDENETVADSNWQLNGATYLESWGDTEAWNGAIAPIQPLIAPLYAGRSDLEVLSMLLGDEKPDGYELVRARWRKKLGDALFEKNWRIALHNGISPEGYASSTAAPVQMAQVGQMIGGMTVSPGPGDSSLDVVFTVGAIADGRWANNPWLQELPDPATKIVWDNVALMSPATAKRLNLLPEGETVKKRGAAMATITIGSMSMDIPAWVLPGMPENTVLLPLGYGRSVSGLVAAGVGFNTYKIRGSASRRIAQGAKVERSRAASYNISTTQQHGSLEGRAIVREVDLPAWQMFGAAVDKRKDHYGNDLAINFAERLGEAAHAPKNLSIYENPFNRSHGDPDPTKLDAKGRPPAYSKGPQWGMSIDLSTCIGCNVCTIACQAENNIPVVGKIEVNKGREMQWIRVDRYFVSDEHFREREPSRTHPDDPSLSMVFQPVACVHCENAPCETVCPVNATVHGPEGINYMAYNRCIGTRYCANNCPYKVRRFNFFDFGVAKYKGYLKEGVEREIGDVPLPANDNLIPPRLRKLLDEITKMQMNPDVTVRSRGVMEKCSYCIQRINEARIEVKLQNPPLPDAPGIPDGFFQTACQQACPTGAIVFGDLLDTTSDDGHGNKGSRVKHLRDHGRAYLLLGFLDTRPRTTHMVAVRNPNPIIRAPQTEIFHDHEGGDDAPAAGHDEAHAFHEENGRDEGHRMSLTVLNGAPA